MKWSELPQEYRDLSLGFPKEADFETIGEEGEEIENIGGMFYWDDTDQGYDFWCQCNEATTIEELPEIPQQQTA